MRTTTFFSLLISATLISFATTNSLGAEKKAAAKAGAKAAAKKAAPAKAAPKHEPVMPPPAEPTPAVQEPAAPAAPAAVEPAKREEPKMVSSSSDDLKSRFFFQPAAGKSAFTAELWYLSSTMDTLDQNDVVSSTLKASTMPILLMYQYGFSDYFGLGVSLDYGTDTYKETAAGSTTEVTSKYVGMSDLTVAFNMAQGMGGWSLRYGADLGINTAKKKDPTGTEDGNRSSGGMSLTPYVGAQWMLNSQHSIGARLRYSYLMDRSYDANTNKLTGGNVIDLVPFYEMQLNPLVLDVSLGISSVASEVKKNSNGDEVVTTSGYTVIKPSISGSYDFSDALSLTFGVGMNMRPVVKYSVAGVTAGSVAAHNSMNAKLGLQINF